MLLDKFLFEKKISEIKKKLNNDLLSLKSKENEKRQLHSGNHCNSTYRLLLEYIDEIAQQIKDNCRNKIITEKTKNIPNYNEIKKDLDGKLNPLISEFEKIFYGEVRVAMRNDDERNKRIIKELSFRENAESKLNIFYRELENELKELCIKISNEQKKIMIAEEANKISRWALFVALISAAISILSALAKSDFFFYLSRKIGEFFYIVLRIVLPFRIDLF